MSRKVRPYKTSEGDREHLLDAMDRCSAALDREGFRRYAEDVRSLKTNVEITFDLEDENG